MRPDAASFRLSVGAEKCYIKSITVWSMSINPGSKQQIVAYDIIQWKMQVILHHFCTYYRINTFLACQPNPCQPKLFYFLPLQANHKPLSLSRDNNTKTSTAPTLSPPLNHNRLEPAEVEHKFPFIRNTEIKQRWVKRAEAECASYKRDQRCPKIQWPISQFRRVSS